VTEPGGVRAGGGEAPIRCDSMGAQTILVVEDDEPIARALAGALESQGYSIARAATGAEALRRVREEPPELVLLDLGLPDVDGVEVCRVLRDLDPVLPIVVLTARHDEIDVVLGLDAGADDYVTKPFRLAELLARVRAHLRQPRSDDQTVLRVGDVEVDRDSRRVRVGDHELDLRAKEFDLLAFLVGEAGSAVTRERIMSEVWDTHWFGSTKTLDMHVSSLRRKLAEVDGEAAEPGVITTLRGVGYRFEVP
jgi:DNA-binding response OmpR family regulator